MKYYKELCVLPTQCKEVFCWTHTVNGDYCSGKPGSSVGMATELRAGRSGIESRWGRDFPPVQTGPGAHPTSCTVGTGSFPGVKCGRGVLLTTHPLLVPQSWKSRAIPLPPPSGPHRASNGNLLFRCTTIWSCDYCHSREGICPACSRNWNIYNLNKFKLSDY